MMELGGKYAASSVSGFEIKSFGPGAGDLTASRDGHSITIPLDKIKTFTSGMEKDIDGFIIGVDYVERLINAIGKTQAAAVEWMAGAVHGAMKWLIAVSPLLLGMFLYFGEKPDGSHRAALALITFSALSVILPRWFLFSAIDAEMHPESEPRYLAAAAFSVWFFASFTSACIMNAIYNKMPGGLETMTRGGR